MLQVTDLNQHYGSSHTLKRVQFDVPSDGCTVLLGRNGVGKTTLLKCLMGVVPASSGQIQFEGHDITRLAPYERARLGIGYVPQGREIFPRLTVEENLLIGLAGKRAATKIPANVLELFPVLQQMLHRRGGDLSGGQQQQLAIARALVMKPRLLILDEPTEGIQPSIIKDIARILKEIRKLRDLTIVVSEQVLSFTMEIADRFYVIEKGRFIHEDSRANVDAAKISRYLSV
jgi:urea transport system ATP-binding protein